MKRRYEFAIDGSNDIFGQDETDPGLAVGSIEQAQQALNLMARDYHEWFDEDDRPRCWVVLRRQSDHQTVAVFSPRRFVTPAGMLKVRWTRSRGMK